MTVPEKLRQAIQQHYDAEQVKVENDPASGDEKVYAFGMLPDTTIQGWFLVGDLDELEEKLRANGEL